MQDLAGGEVTLALLAGQDVARIHSREATNPDHRPVLILDLGPEGPPADDTPPTAPRNLHAQRAATDQASLSWDASTDDVGVTSYEVHRSSSSGFTPDGTTLLDPPTTGTTYTDTTVPAGTVYYQVVALDAAGNQSPASNEADGHRPDRSRNGGGAGGWRMRWCTRGCIRSAVRRGVATSRCWVTRRSPGTCGSPCPSWRRART